MKELNLLDTAIRSGIFQTFTRLLEGSDLEKKLRGTESYTLLAPVDVAFAYLPPETLNHLLRAENQGVLANVLEYHAIGRKLMSKEIENQSEVITVCGNKITICNDIELRVDGAKLLHCDIVARNGVIHGIDRLLIPREKTMTVSA